MSTDQTTDANRIATALERIANALEATLIMQDHDGQHSHYLFTEDNR